MTLPREKVIPLDQVTDYQRDHGWCWLKRTHRDRPRAIR